DTLKNDLHWLQIEWQEGPDVGGPTGPYFQSERSEIYDQYYRQLEEMGLAYPCFCTDAELALNRKLQLSRGQPPRYPGTCRKLSKEQIDKKIADGLKPALRFHVPDNQQIDFVDSVKGQQRFNSHDIGDFIIRRADGGSSFMFCNAIDDSLMGVTNVLRGEDHLTNTPRQLMILDALQLRKPDYGHLSLITNEDSMRLSKRKGSFSLHDLREEGYLSLAVLNYLSRLTHTYEDAELLDFTTLAKKFRLDKLSRSPARFDRNQLLHWQKETILSIKDTETIWQWLGETIKNKIPEDKKDLFAKVMQKNILFPHEADQWADILFGNGPHWNEEKLSLLKQTSGDFFKTAREVFQQHQGNLKIILDELKKSLGISGKNLFMPLRLALTGEEHGPELVQIVEFLGMDEVLKRLKDPRE
ncbi:MAG TPA: glutamate--tRNA ligase, partial [Gammaproteobacteria bacterium]|nr:glutamate--tRNA ligase [Gammaproteobacteria bacterium]